jgi:hypothetical protein
LVVCKIKFLTMFIYVKQFGDPYLNKKIRLCNNIHFYCIIFMTTKQQRIGLLSLKNKFGNFRTNKNNNFGIKVCFLFGD